MSTHVSFLRFLHRFVLAKLATYFNFYSFLGNYDLKRFPIICIIHTISKLSIEQNLYFASIIPFALILAKHEIEMRENGFYSTDI